jgi:hypothetical protein
MTVGTLPEFIVATVNLLRMAWGPHCHTFKVQEAEELTGKLNHIAFSTPWMKYLLRTIYSSLTTALHVNNSHLIHSSTCFCDTLRVICNTPPSPNGDALHAFHASSNAKSVHECTLLHHIGGDF